jgi:hypothetical protein
MSIDFERPASHPADDFGMKLVTPIAVALGRKPVGAAGAIPPA